MKNRHSDYCHGVICDGRIWQCWEGEYFPIVHGKIIFPNISRGFESPELALEWIDEVSDEWIENYLRANNPLDILDIMS